MRILPCLIALYVFSMCVYAKPVPTAPRYVVDLSRGRHMEDVLRGGAPFKIINDNQFGTAYLIESACLLFRFPDGIELVLFVDNYIIDTERGLIKTGEGSGLIMPVEEAYQIVRQAHVTAGIPLGRLEEWMTEYRAAPHGMDSVQRFLNGTQVAAPDPDQVKFSFGLGIAPAINPLYPAVVGLSFGFRKDCVAPPGTVFRQIKLDPSQVYDRAEAYRELAAEMKARQSASDSTPATPNPNSKTEVITGTSAIRESGQPINWQLWLTLFFVLLFLLYLARCLRKTRRE